MIGSPRAMRSINGWLTVVWLVMVPVSYFAGWLDSVVYVSALSLWALVSGHWAAWMAGRVEVKQHEDNDVADVIEALQTLEHKLAGHLDRLHSGVEYIAQEATELVEQADDLSEQTEDLAEQTGQMKRVTTTA
jgi:hypothetical protein